MKPREGQHAQNLFFFLKKKTGMKPREGEHARRVWNLA